MKKPRPQSQQIEALSKKIAPLLDNTDLCVVIRVLNYYREHASDQWKDGHLHFYNLLIPEYCR